MSNIGMLHFKVGSTDGVSLEMDKWKLILEEMGHTVHFAGGDLGTFDGTLIEEMYHHRPDSRRLYDNTFIALTDFDVPGYGAALNDLSAKIEAKLRTWIKEKNIDFLIPHNIWSVAVNPAVAPALTKVVGEFQIPTFSHNHDFYWERVDGVALTCRPAIDLADFHLPPRDPLINHGVINSLAQTQLRQRKGIESIVIPNVFDFDAPHWDVDEYNQDFRKHIGLRENDVLILQATRIVPRKGIELAVDFVAALNTPERRSQLAEKGLYNGRSFTKDSRIVLVLAGYAQDDTTGYVSKLHHKIEQAGIDALFIEDIIGGQRDIRDGQKIYSLWDTYVYADFITYPSLWEGWGNQLLEAIRSKTPYLLFEYPVYVADIKKSNLKAVSLGQEVTSWDENGLAQVPDAVIQRCADEAVALLTNPKLRQQTVEHNFQVGKQHYSMDALRGYLMTVMDR
jgi:glycosyltransferase involved in cell wall biosynthesis